MNNRVFRLSLISVFLMSIFSNFVSAAERGFITMLNKFGELLFIQVAGLEEYAFKFIIWILLFALFQYGLKKTFSEGKTAGILSFFLSFGSVLAMPNGWVVGIFTTYAHVIAIALALLAPILGFWLNHTWFNQDTTFQNLMGGVIYLIIGYAFGSVLETLESIVAKAGSIGAISTITSFAYFGMYVCFFVGAWKIISSFGGIGGQGRIKGAVADVAESVGEKSAGVAEKGEDWLKDILSTERRLGRKLRRTGKKMEKSIGEIVTAYNRLKAAIEKARIQPGFVNVVAENADKVFPVVNKSMEIIKEFEKMIEHREKWQEGEIVKIRETVDLLEKNKELVKPELKEQIEAYVKTMNDISKNATAVDERLKEMENVVEEIKSLDENVKGRNDTILRYIEMRSTTGLNSAWGEITKSIDELKRMEGELPKIDEYVQNVNALIQSAYKIVRHDLKKEVDRIEKEVAREQAAERRRPHLEDRGPQR